MSALHRYIRYKRYRIYIEQVQGNVQFEVVSVCPQGQQHSSFNSLAKVLFDYVRCKVVEYKQKVPLGESFHT